MGDYSVVSGYEKKCTYVDLCSSYHTETFADFCFVLQQFL